MLSKLNSLRDREDGFTLIELLIVVIIIGILAAIALPIFIDQSKIAVDASVQSDVRNSVTNVTNAQAQSLGSTGAITARAALSSDKTHIVLRSASTTSNEATRNGSQVFTDVPALGAAYDLCGFNADGKKFTGVDDKAFGFDAATGKFSEVSNCSVSTPYAGSGTGTPGDGTDPNGGGNPAGGGNPSGGGDNPTTDDPGTPKTNVTVTNLSISQNYQYNGSVRFGTSAYNRPFGSVDLGKSNAKIVSSGTPVANGLTAGQSVSTAASDVKVYDTNGNLHPAAIKNCNFVATVVSGGSDSDSYRANLSCAFDWDNAYDGAWVFSDNPYPYTVTDTDEDGYPTAVRNDFLLDGKVTFVDDKNRVNTLVLTDGFTKYDDN